MASGLICGFGPIAASFGKLKARERFGLKTRGGGTAFPASTYTLTTGYEDSVSRSVSVYASAFSGICYVYPRRDGQAELT